MTISKTITLLGFIIAFAQPLLAQDPRFSQYYMSPWQLNPAMTGVFNGRWRVNLNYRDQWSSILSPVPFRTYAASFDARLNINDEDYAAFGLGILHDEAGAARYNQNSVLLGGSFIKQLSGGRNRAEHFLAAGAQLGMGQHALDWGKLWFSRQFDPVAETPDPNAPNFEPTTDGATGLYADFNAGLMWYTLFENDGFAYAGAALHHINSPKLSFTGNDQINLYSRWSGHAGGQFPLNENFAILPGVWVMQQGPAFETNAGLNVRYSNNDQDELAVRAGAWLRLGNRLDRGIQADAVVITGILERNRWMLGLSYDVTVSTLSVANNGRGAFEISLTYFHPEYRRSRVKCPVF